MVVIHYDSYYHSKFYHDIFFEAIYRYACAETHPSGNNFINGYASSLKPIVITMIAEAGVGSRGRALMRSKLEKPKKHKKNKL